MVIYFSGNGNSRFIADTVAQKLNTAKIELTGDILRFPSSCDIETHDDVIVWIFPVYSWGIPPVVENFIMNCNIHGASKNEHHLIITCGDDAGMTAKQWRKLIEQRGWKSFSATSIIMPNTYVLMKGFNVDSANVEQRKIDNSSASLNKAIKRIESHNTDEEIKQGRFPRFKSYIIYPWFKRYAMSSRPFHTTPACILCKKCINNCPMQNISLQDNNIKWSEHCAMCLKCFHSCPVNAIQYGKATKNKLQYKRFNNH